MCFVQTLQNLMLLVCSAESEKSINRVWAGKGKFIAQWHFRSKSETAQSTGELARIHNVKSSGNRQVKAELTEDVANAF